MPSLVALGIDLGTSKIGAVLLDASSRQLVRAAERTNDALIAGLPQGLHEQDPRRILQLASEACREVLEDLGSARLAGLAITGQMHGVLLADAAWNPLTPLITWRDRRGVGDFLDSLRAAAGAQASQRTGCLLNLGYGGVTLAWLERHGGIPRGCTALTIADWLAAQLCGVGATDRSHAASWGLCDLADGRWDGEVLDALGIPEDILPDIRPSGTAVGMTNSASASFGVPERIPVWLPLGDNQASVHAATGGRTDLLTLNIGTGGQISAPTYQVVCENGVETRPRVDGGLLRVGASLCGGWSYAYLAGFYQQVCREIGGVDVPLKRVFDRMSASAQTVGKTRLEVDVRFAGERGSRGAEGAAQGAIRCIDESNLVPAGLTYAFQIGMVRELAALAGPLEGIRGVVASGNAVRKTPGFADVVEKVFGLPCMLSSYREEAACGAVLRMLEEMQ